MKQKASPVVVVVDIGGSKYMPGFVDVTGRILVQERREWVHRTQEDIYAQIARSIEDMRADHPELWQRTAAGGLTIPGFADPVSGTWVESDFLPVKELEICALLTKRFGIPFYCDNDGNACALAERYFGGARAGENFLYMTVSTGIGGAPFLNGRLYYGDFWHAGEIGLFVAEEKGRWSDTGSMQGVLEMHASGRGLAANFLEYGGREEYEGKKPAGPEISQLARQGDPPALLALKNEGIYLGRAIANACALADFQKVILGGGISLLFDQYRDSLLAEFRRIWPERRVDIEATTLGYTGAFLGAAAVALRGMETKGSLPGPERSTITIHVGKKIRGSRALSGVACPSGKEDWGGYLVSASLTDAGKKLNELASLVNWQECLVYPGEKEQALLGMFGHSVGKSAAAAAMLLDPGGFRIQGAVAQNSYFQQGFLRALTAETYYRGNFPFEITFAGEE